MDRISGFSKSVAIAALTILMWESAAFVVQSAGFPHLWSVFAEVLHIATLAKFWSDFLATMWISLAGFVIGSLIAVLLGLFMGLNKNVELASRGTLNFIRVIPSVVLLPLLIASIGSSPRTAVILAAYVVASTLVTYVIRGIVDTEVKLIETANAIQLPKKFQIIFLYLPSTISLVGTGMRLSASRAFGTVVTAGLVAGTPGLGAQLYMAQANSEVNRVFAYVVVMGLTGVGIYALFSRVERYLFQWRVAV